MYVLVRSPFGRSLAGIRERELRMKILGYNTWLHKYIAFIIAGGFGGLAGVLWAHTAGIVSPENVVLTTSVDALLMAVLGRRRNARRRSHRLLHRHWFARICQHAGPLVAVRAGRSLCADHSLSAERVDGHSGANSPAPLLSERTSSAGNRTFLPSSKASQQRRKDYDKRFTTKAQSRAARRLSRIRDGREARGAAPRSCASAFWRRRPASSPRSARIWSMAFRCISTSTRTASAARR